MDYKNGYKVVYEFAANGERTFYAATTSTYPNRDKDGNITDTKLASFVDADFEGKTIYEYKGEFYVSTGALPAYNEDGTPKDNKIKGFEKLFVEGYEEGEPAAPDAGDDNDPVDPDAGYDDGDNGDTE